MEKETGLGFALYGTPAESLCYRFARIDKERFGTIADVTDKGYYTNSYHVDVREDIDAFSKFNFESQFQRISSGGAISYVEILICAITWKQWKMLFALFMTIFNMLNLILNQITAMCAGLMVRLS